jgi:glycosyltransferase involved in cell wall biosynthesis
MNNLFAARRRATGKPKVLIAAGPGHVTESEMIIQLHKSGVDVHAAFESNSSQLSRLCAAGVPTRTLDLRGTIDPASIRRIRKWVRDEGFNVLHALANWQVANFLLASYGMPNHVIAYRGAIGHVSKWDPSCYLKWLSPRLDRIVCVSNAVAHDLKASSVDEKKLVTIYKGHDLSWYSSLNPPLARQHVNQTFGIPSDAVLIGMAANMRPVKGADMLLEALKALPDSVHALMIGEVRDPHLEELANDPSIRNRVHMTGYRNDAPALIGALDINCAPSRGREGLTKTILEGMAQGIPSIVSAAGGLPEMIDNGESGYVFATDELSDFINKLRQLVASPERRELFGQRGREIVQERFSIDQTVTKTAALYSALCS